MYLQQAAYTQESCSPSEQLYVPSNFWAYYAQDTADKPLAFLAFLVLRLGKLLLVSLALGATSSYAQVTSAIDHFAGWSMPSQRYRNDYENGQVAILLRIPVKCYRARSSPANDFLNIEDGKIHVFEQCPRVEIVRLGGQPETLLTVQSKFREIRGPASGADLRLTSQHHTVRLGTFGLGQHDLRIVVTYPSNFTELLDDYLFKRCGEPGTSSAAHCNTVNIKSIRRIVGSASTALHSFRWDRRVTIVGLGDSYASGEGLPLVCGRVAEDNLGDWLKATATDSSVLLNVVTGQFLPALGTASWKALAEIDQVECLRGQLNVDPPPIWIASDSGRSYNTPSYVAAAVYGQQRPNSMVTYFNLAVSGAEISAGDTSLLRQLDSIEVDLATHSIDALIVSIAGNDVGFSSFLKDALVGVVAVSPDVPRQNVSIDMAAAKYAERIDRALAAIPVSLEAVYRRVNRMGNIKNVYLVEYPEGLFSSAASRPEAPVDADSCGLFDNYFMKITTAETRLARTTAQRLNAIIREFVASRPVSDLQARWHFVGGVARAFEGHGYCVNDSYFIHFKRSCECQGNIRGTMHMTVPAARAVGTLVGAELLRGVP